MGFLGRRGVDSSCRKRFSRKQRGKTWVMMKGPDHQQRNRRSRQLAEIHQSVSLKAPPSNNYTMPTLGMSAGTLLDNTHSHVKIHQHAFARE